MSRTEGEWEGSGVRCVRRNSCRVTGLDTGPDRATKTSRRGTRRTGRSGTRPETSLLNRGSTCTGWGMWSTRGERKERMDPGTFGRHKDPTDSGTRHGCGRIRNPPRGTSPPWTSFVDSTQGLLETLSSFSVRLRDGYGDPKVDPPTRVSPGVRHRHACQVPTSPSEIPVVRCSP